MQIKFIGFCYKFHFPRVIQSSVFVIWHSQTNYVQKFSSNFFAGQKCLNKKREDLGNGLKVNPLLLFVFVLPVDTEKKGNSSEITWNSDDNNMNGETCLKCYFKEKDCIDVEIGI